MLIPVLDFDEMATISRAAERNFPSELEALAESVRRNRLAPQAHLDAVGRFVLAARLSSTARETDDATQLGDVPVFSPEVNVEHVYHFGETGLLVHNFYPRPTTVLSASGETFGTLWKHFWQRLGRDQSALPDGSHLSQEALLRGMVNGEVR